MPDSAHPFPESIAEIPDGQRRWARANKKSFKEAYEIGAQNTRLHIAVARSAGVKRFAIWGGSVENLLHRPADELVILHAIYERFLQDVRDRWMDEGENRDLRFVHMGRPDLLSKKESALITEIADITRPRTGMVVALCLGYGGKDEEERARLAWQQSGSQGRYEDYLDLPRQGIPYAPFDLIIRTGEGGDCILHDNEFLSAYRGETRLRFHPEFYPDFTPEMLRADIDLFRQSEQRRGA
jgi:undecaprenyl diphosphate synthase